MTEHYQSVQAMGDRAPEITANHIDLAFRAMITPTEEARVTERYVLVSTGAPHPLANFVLGLSSDDLSGIEETMPEMTAREVPASYLFTGPQPEGDVHTTLEGGGFMYHGGMPGMTCELDQVPSTPLPEGYDLIEVETEEQAQGWVSTFTAGYGLPDSIGRMFWPRATASTRFYSILHGGKTVSTSALLLDAGVAGIYCVATLPEYRGKGLGAHITAEPLRQALNEGYRVGVLQASELGYGIYKRLGFEDCGQVHLYIRMPA